METTLENRKSKKVGKVKRFGNWLYMKTRLTTPKWEKHETRILYLVENLLKNKDTKCMTSVMSSIVNDELGLTILLNPTDISNEAIVIYKVDGTVSKTIVSDYVFDELSKLVHKEIITRIFQEVNTINLQEKLKLKEITNKIYGNIDGES